MGLIKEIALLEKEICSHEIALVNALRNNSSAEQIKNIKNKILCKKNILEALLKSEKCNEQ